MESIDDRSLEEKLTIDHFRTLVNQATNQLKILSRLQPKEVERDYHEELLEEYKNQTKRLSDTSFTYEISELNEAFEEILKTDPNSLTGDDALFFQNDLINFQEKLKAFYESEENNHLKDKIEKFISSVQSRFYRVRKKCAGKVDLSSLTILDAVHIEKEEEAKRQQEVAAARKAEKAKLKAEQAAKEAEKAAKLAAAYPGSEDIPSGILGVNSYDYD